MKIEELFDKDISNEHALELKGLGFNEPCINSFEYAPGEFCNIPSYLQSFVWFKNQYGLNQTVEYDGNNNIFFAVVNTEYKGQFQTWDEAMFECLNELINIVKTQ
jgi:hypothetical protein